MDHDDAEESLPEFAAMQADEIEELLAELGLDLTDDELHQVSQFIRQSGSIQAALEALAELERRAA